MLRESNKLVRVALQARNAAELGSITNPHGVINRYCAAGITNPYYHGVITRSANRATLIPVATATFITGFLSRRQVFYLTGRVDNTKLRDITLTDHEFADRLNHAAQNRY